MKFEYTIIRSQRKTLSLQVDKDCQITVRAPFYTSEREIELFLQEKKTWLEKAIITQREKVKKQKTYSPEEIEIFRKKAKEIIPDKVRYFSSIMGVTPTSVRINSAKTRYGSCSGKNSLNFSLYLMDKNEEFIDYVVIHELAHIKHHNHSKEFYSFIEMFLPDYKNIVKRNK